MTRKRNKVPAGTICGCCCEDIGTIYDVEQLLWDVPLLGMPLEDSEGFYRYDYLCEECVTEPLYVMLSSAYSLKGRLELMEQITKQKKSYPEVYRYIKDHMGCSCLVCGEYLEGEGIWRPKPYTDVLWRGYRKVLMSEGLSEKDYDSLPLCIKCGEDIEIRSIKRRKIETLPLLIAEPWMGERSKQCVLERLRTGK